jgi:hypothetical protein
VLSNPVCRDTCLLCRKDYLSVQQARRWSYHLGNEVDEGVTEVLKCRSAQLASAKAQYQETRMNCLITVESIAQQLKMLGLDSVLFPNV